MDFSTALNRVFTTTKMALKNDNLFGVVVEGIAVHAGLDQFLSVVRTFTPEQKEMLEQISLSIELMNERIERINKQLVRFKICLDDLKIRETQNKIKDLLRKNAINYVKRKFTGSSFLASLERLVNDLTFYFTVYLSDFSEVIFATTNPRDPVNREILVSMEEMCSKIKKRIIEMNTGSELGTYTQSPGKKYQKISMSPGSPRGRSASKSPRASPRSSRASPRGSPQGSRVSPRGTRASPGQSARAKDLEAFEKF